MVQTSCRIRECRKKLQIVKMVLPEHKDYLKHLGILIDKNLSWKHHIDHIIIKLSRTVRLNAILRHFLLTHTLLCQALMPPYLTYGLKVWGSGQFAEYGRTRRDLARAEPFFAACNATKNSRVQPSVHGDAVPVAVLCAVDSLSAEIKMNLAIKLIYLTQSSH